MLRFRAATARGEEVASREVELGKGANVRPALKALFGARRVLGLEYLINSNYPVDQLRDQLERLQYDAAEILHQDVVPSKVYAENVREDARKALRSLLVREALEYGLASAETAFVAVRTEAGKPVEGTVPVANALPLGWVEHFLASPGMMKSAFGAPGVAYQAMSAPDASRVFRARPSFLGRRDQLASIIPFVPEPAEAPKPTVIFSGIPSFVGAEAVLFDSSRDEDAAMIAESATIRLIEVRFPDGEPERTALDPGLALVVFVGDLASPRARMALVDLLRRRGQRPLNVSKAKGDIVRIVLVDPQGAWKDGAPKIEVGLAW
jgi:Ca-activated chloride channel family protein